MKYDDLDKTGDLFDLLEDEVPSPIDNIDMEGASKDNLTEEIKVVEEEPKKEEKKKKEKKSLKEKWKGLPKKKKVLIIVLSVIVVLIIIGLVLFLVLHKKEEPKKEEPKAPEVILEKDNYIYKDGVLSFLDKNGEEIGTYECKNANENLCYIPDYNTEDDFDVPKNVYEDETVIGTHVQIYNDNYVFIYDNDKETDGLITLYNIKDKKEEGTYSLVKGFADTNYVILKDEKDLYGALEFSANGIEQKVDFKYDYIGQINSDSNLVVKDKGKYYIYDVNGISESKGTSSKIKNYNNNFIVTDDYEIFSYSGKQILEDSYDYIVLLDSYMGVVDSRKLYIYDYQGVKYNEEGISLGNTNYNIINVYDKDKKLIETKKSFELKVEDNIINVSYIKNDDEKSATIDVNEGKFNKNLEYINYFDGVLYFYNDEEKDNLLGSYTCTNRNNITTKTKALENCLIATGSFYSKNGIEEDNSKNVGIIPIFNNNYVFIFDSISKDKSNIVLYDLKKSKVLSKYESVDIGTYVKEENITFENTDNKLIMAKNTSGKYGMIRITNTSIKGTVAFLYNSIEKFKDYYLVSLGSGNKVNYLLVDDLGKEITAKFDGKIIGYSGKYLNVIKNNKYYVYNFDGTTSDETGYNYISLYDKFYAVITTDSKLDLRLYDDPDFHLETPISITSKNYATAFDVYQNTTGGFTVRIKDTNTTYIINSDGSIET